MSIPDQGRVSIGRWGRLHWLRLSEMLALFVAMPVALAFFRDVISPIPVLILVGTAVLVMLLRDPSFERSTLWSTAGLGRAIRQMVPMWLGTAGVVAAALYLIRPDSLFAFPRTRPATWVLVMTLYPLFSVIPQSIIYRAFFTHRYQVLFGKGLAMILAGALAFGLAHVIFKHWIPVVLTVVAGALFVCRHLEYKSMLAGAIEHAMYGNMVFTLGLGMFFYHGAGRVLPPGP
jgi:hypothetical protein